MNRLILLLVVAAGALAFAGKAEADIRVEPDDFRDGAILTHAVPGVALSLSLADGTVRDDAWIVSSITFGPTTSTGVRVFGAAASTGQGPHFWYSASNLRADFDEKVHAVSLDFIGVSTSADSPTRGLLRAFSSDGALLTSESTEVLPAGGIARLTVTWSDAPIAYVLASAAEGSAPLYLDNFVASTVPLPPAVWLLTAGLVLLAATAQRGRQAVRF
jgi:hypothetical protein